MHERVFDPGGTLVGRAVITVPQTTQKMLPFRLGKSQGCGQDQIKPSQRSMCLRGWGVGGGANKAAGQSDLAFI